MKSSFKEKALFIIALLLMNYRVNLIGSMSLTEIYVVTQIPRLLKWIDGPGKRIPYLHKIVNAFYLLICIQCVAEFMVDNSLTNAMKGVAVTVMALFLMLFFLEKLAKDISLAVWIPICSAIGLITFGDQFGFADKGEITYFKFYVAPIVANAAIALSVLARYKWVQRNIYMLLMGVSLFIIIGGARSLGFSMFFTVFALFLYNRYRTVRFKRLLPGLIICAIIVQSFLTFMYMPKVKSGEWGSEQNRNQFEKIDWNSNIFMILFSARTDFFVSTIAFLDKPLWGFGSWAVDYTGKYHIIQAEIMGDEYKVNPETFGYVPCHSVVMGKGVSNGIFAFLIFLWIFITIYGIGLKGLRPNSIYNVFLLWTIISSFQHLMFGPPAILKNKGAIAFAVMFALYYINYKENGTKSNTIRSNGNV